MFWINTLLFIHIESQSCFVAFTILTWHVLKHHIHSISFDNINNHNFYSNNLIVSDDISFFFLLSLLSLMWTPQQLLQPVPPHTLFHSYSPSNLTKIPSFAKLNSTHHSKIRNGVAKTTITLEELPPNALRRKREAEWSGGFSLGLDLGMARTGIALSKGFIVRPLTVTLSTFSCYNEFSLQFGTLSASHNLLRAFLGHDWSIFGSCNHWVRVLGMNRRRVYGRLVRDPYLALKKTYKNKLKTTY